jgi:hypothetical protein
MPRSEGTSGRTVNDDGQPVAVLERTMACHECEGAGSVRSDTPDGEAIECGRCATCEGSGQVSQRVHLSPGESRALWADEARRKMEAKRAKLRADVERLRVLVADLPDEDEERALVEERRELARRRQRARWKARAKEQCPTCEVPASDGAGHGSWDTELACPECGKAARPTRRDLHGWLDRLIEVRACAEGRSSCASETTEGVRRALTRVALEDGEDLRPSLRSVRIALRCDDRFTYEPGMRPFDAGFWYWEVRGVE